MCYPPPSHQNRIVNRKLDQNPKGRILIKKCQAPVKMQPEISMFFKSTGPFSSEEKKRWPVQEARYKRSKSGKDPKLKIPKIRRSQLADNRKRKKKKTNDNEKFRTVKELWAAAVEAKTSSKRRKLTRRKKVCSSFEESKEPILNNDHFQSEIFFREVSEEDDHPQSRNIKKDRFISRSSQKSTSKHVLQSRNLNRGVPSENELPCTQSKKRRSAPSKRNHIHKRKRRKSANEVLAPAKMCTQPYQAKTLDIIPRPPIPRSLPPSSKGEPPEEKEGSFINTPSPYKSTNAEVELSRKGTGPIPSPRYMHEHEGPVRSVLDSNRYSGSSSLQKHTQIRLPRLDVKVRKCNNNTRRRIAFEDKPKRDSNSDGERNSDIAAASPPPEQNEQVKDTRRILNNDKLDLLLRLTDEYCSTTESSSDERPSPVCFDTAVWEALKQQTEVDALVNGSWIKCRVTNINAWAATVRPCSKSPNAGVEFEVANTEHLRVSSYKSPLSGSSPKGIESPTTERHSNLADTATAMERESSFVDSSISKRRGKSKKRRKTVSTDPSIKHKARKQKQIKLNKTSVRNVQDSEIKSRLDESEREQNDDESVPAGGERQDSSRSDASTGRKRKGVFTDSQSVVFIKPVARSVSNCSSFQQLIKWDKSYHAMNAYAILKEMSEDKESLQFKHEMAEFVSAIAAAEVILRENETSRLRVLEKNINTRKKKRVQFCCHDFSTQQPPTGVNTHKPYGELLHHLFLASQSALHLFNRGAEGSLIYKRQILDFMNRLKEKVRSATLLKQRQKAGMLLLREFMATLKSDNPCKYPFQSKLSMILSSLVRYEMRLIFNCSEWCEDSPSWADNLGGYMLPAGVEFDDTISMEEQGIDFFPYHAAEISINLQVYHELNKDMAETKLYTVEDKEELVHFFADIFEVFQEHPVMLGLFETWGNDVTALPRFERFLYDSWSRLRGHLECIKEAQCEELYGFLPLLDFQGFLKNFLDMREALT